MLRCDWSSARAFCHRQGVGRVRHISCGLLWLQDLVQQGDLEVKQVSTWRNTGDLSTKIQSKRRIRFLLNLMGFVDTHNGHAPLQWVKRKDLRTSLERKAVERISPSNVQNVQSTYGTITAGGRYRIPSARAWVTGQGTTGTHHSGCESCFSKVSAGWGGRPHKRDWRRQRKPSKRYGMRQLNQIGHILESGNARLQEQAALAEENPQRVRSELHALRLLVQRLGQETSEPTMVAQTNMPGLRERIIREAQGRGIEFSIRGESDEEGPEEPSDQDSDWYPGRDEDEGYGIELNGWMSTGTSKSMNWCTNHWSILQTLRQQRYQPLRSKNYSLKKSQWEPGNS